MSIDFPRIVPNSENTLIEAKVSDLTTEFVSVDMVDAADALPANTYPAEDEQKGGVVCVPPHRGTQAKDSASLGGGGAQEILNCHQDEGGRR